MFVKLLDALMGGNADSHKKANINAFKKHIEIG